MSIGPQRPESMLGQVIADYELTAFIGTGATGLVYRGRRTANAPASVEQTGRVALEFPEDAAIKLLVPPLGATQDELEDFQRRFVREARILKQLDHPHILPVIDYGQDTDSGYFYMILTYMAGGSLAHMIATRGPLSLAETSSILAQVADALDYAHAEQVVHRDVKPGNILLDAHGTPFLSDFSIVRVVSEAATQRTTTGRMMGTPAYMAPEQFDDSSNVGAAADIYGLGMVVYEMVTGHAAFGSTSWAQVMRQQLMEAPTLPGATRPDLPRPAEAAIMQALAKEPAQRFPTAAAFARAFSLGLQGQWADGLTRYVAPSARPTTGQSAAQTMPARMPDRPQRRSRVGALFAAVLLLLVCACVGGVAFGSPGSPLPAILAAFMPHTPTTGVQANVATVTITPGHKATVRPTATKKKGGSGAPVPTATPSGPTPTPIPGATATPTPTPTATPTPTPTPTATPVPPTPTPTLCPYLNGGVGVYFYDQPNYSGNSWLFYVSPGQVNTVVNLPSPIAGHLNSIADTNQAWTIVVYQGQNGTGNLGFYYSSQPTISSYWQATQSVKIYVNRAC